MPTARRHPTSPLVVLLVGLLTGLVAIAVPSSTIPAAAADDAPAAPLQLAELEQTAERSGSVAVLVGVASSVEGDPTAAIAAELSGTSFEVEPVTDDLVAVEADAEALERLAQAEVVADLGADPLLHVAAAAQAVVPSVTRTDVAHAVGNTGTGATVVVVDTGVDTTHPALAGAVVAEACFVRRLGGLCPNGQPTQVGPGAGVPCTVDRTVCGHGTHVAGIVAGREVGSLPAGVAPGAQLVAIRVFDADPNSSGTIAARTSDLIAALEHVKALHLTMPIDAVNLSISGEALYDGACDEVPDVGFEVQRLARTIEELRAAGIATVAASGNGSDPERISFPACLSAAVPVTATTAGDGVAPFSNRNRLLTLAAPGTNILAAVPGNRAEARSGTSMAAPQVSGAIALLRQRYRAPTVSWVIDRLTTTAKEIIDPATGRTLRRVDVAPALGLAATASGQPVPAAGAWVITDTGRAVPAGAAPDLGVRPVLPPGERAVAASATRSGLGYWVSTDRGRVIRAGDAPDLGDVSRLALNRPITAMAATRTGQGYWLLGADGGVFSFGDARFHGSTGGMVLNAPVTDMAPSPTGGGYWLTAGDGGVFSFGDARFHGSTGGMVLNQPVVSITAGPAAGYWLVALDGGVFAFDVPFLGSVPGDGVVATSGHRIRASANATGYHILTADGAIRHYGRAEPFGRALLQRGERAVDLVMVP